MTWPPNLNSQNCEKREKANTADPASSGSYLIPYNKTRITVH